MLLLLLLDVSCCACHIMLLAQKGQELDGCKAHMRCCRGVDQLYSYVPVVFG